MLYKIACDAMKAKKCLELRYDGFHRIVEVHAVGMTKDGNEVMRVFQIAGGSNSGKPIGFKLLRLDEAFTSHMADKDSHGPRPDYKRGDPAMKTIYCQL